MWSMRFAGALALLCLPAAGLRADPIGRWQVFETAWTSSVQYDNPFAKVDLRVAFQSPLGETRTVDAFWDGGRTWRVRFSPDVPGAWTWKTACSNPNDRGLHGQTGRFECVDYSGVNPLYRHGPIRVAADGWRFVHADGTPFFWLADTAWNGVLCGTRDEWTEYLEKRAAQRFTAVQFVTTQWRGANARLPRHAFTGTENITLHPEFFQSQDAKVAEINAHGLVAVPVILWACIASDPGRALAEADATRLAKYIVARWGAHQVVWFLGGDGDYEGPNVARWRNIGRAVFADRDDRLVTLHPRGESWVGDEYAGESWFDFVGYQSGHGDGEKSLRWHVAGPLAQWWNARPRLPIVNLEPNYEAFPGYATKRPHDDHHVRRAAYWSVLMAPVSGVTYGHNAIWVWNRESGPAEGHGRLEAASWRTGLEPPGVANMTLLRAFFESGPWTEMLPAGGLLAVQPGDADPSRFVAVGRRSDVGARRRTSRHAGTLVRPAPRPVAGGRSGDGRKADLRGPHDGRLGARPPAAPAAPLAPPRRPEAGNLGRNPGVRTPPCAAP